MRFGFCLSVFSLLFLVSSTTTKAAETSGPRKVEYDRDVRPILSDKCFKCHGPHAEQRQAELRLDRRDDALKTAASGETAIVPGKPSESELVRRINATDPNEAMPPADANKTLTAAEKETLARWIAEGAEYREHWSFVPPQAAEPPQVKDESWVRSPIDRFILARLEREGLKPSSAADNVTLIRRLSLDLTGLPPTPAEVDAFLADMKDGAYDRLVDRLLASPHYGERMALDWLDAARYADTHGFHIDSHRDMWPWRDWVIEAFNRNLPFDRFTVEQLAGDLIPEAAPEQKLASGFNRNHMINFEGGAIPAEYHNAYIVDRVNTTGAVWLGLTVGCAQCHDHKYDPLTQKEYYQLYAFFHNVPENPLDGRKGNAAPMIELPTAAQQESLAKLAEQTKELQAKSDGANAELDAAQAEWEKTATAEQTVAWTVLEPVEIKSRTAETKFTQLDDKSILAGGENNPIDSYAIVLDPGMAEITAVRIEALDDDSLPSRGPGRSPNGNAVLSNVRASVHEADNPMVEERQKFKAGSADFSQKDFPIENAFDDKGDTGWAIYPQVGKPHWCVLEFEKPVTVPEGKRLGIQLDFFSLFAQHQFGRIRISVTKSTDPHAKKGLPENVRAALAVAAEKRNKAQQDQLRTYFRQQVSAEGKKLAAELAALGKQRFDLEQQIPNAMVMEEMAKPRNTFMLVRGQYDKLGEKVTAGVPAALPPLPADAPPNRLSLAKWLVDPAQPLTSRVMVNRYWQSYFGTGLVKTSEDFGSQGEFPTHPELLDWLAARFAAGWDIKAMQRLIVTSATYRQSSAVNKALLSKDPENRLLARGPRLRLPAELIRDQALAASGLLNAKIGGPSVLPYQPSGLWEEMAFGREFTAQTYVQSHGQDLYRRGMYTFWKRTVPPATMSTFDAPDRETCTVRRARTNTPLQALVLMNDPTYVEASRKLAERLLCEAGSSPEERITLAYRLVLARKPKPAEVAVLSKLYEQELIGYRQNSAAALKLLSVGESPRNDKLDVAELAAWTTVASAILNLDETVTKG